ncbi:MAG: hypothetical protein HON48_07810 [Desulfobacula sp.]|jgi:hypothetical protein|nr:hypothetical protein [Desulfobacula sp.]
MSAKGAWALAEDIATAVSKKKINNTINNLDRCGFDIFIKNIQNIKYLSFLKKYTTYPVKQLYGKLITNPV